MFLRKLLVIVVPLILCGLCVFFLPLLGGFGLWSDLLQGLILGALLALLIPAAVSVDAWRGGAARAPVLEPTTAPIGLGLLGVRVDQLEADRPATLRSGMSGYLLPFEIVSVHLLVVLVGAAYLARAKRRRSGA